MAIDSYMAYMMHQSSMGPSSGLFSGGGGSEQYALIKATQDLWEEGKHKKKPDAVIFKTLAKLFESTQGMFSAASLESLSILGQLRPPSSPINPDNRGLDIFGKKQ